MTDTRSVVVNGDLGSGKTTVSTLLAERLGIRRISVGDLYREIARRRGMTALQLNLHAEIDDEVDGHVDRLQREIAASGERLVVDSRLAWFFFTAALKVHLITETTVAATRVLARPSSVEEAYGSVAEAEQRLRERSDSERARFLVRYGADKCRLRNYDLVCDTTRATPEEVVERIVAVVEGRLTVPEEPPLLLVDPARVHPSGAAPEPPTELVGRVAAAGPDGLEPLPAGHVDGTFVLLDSTSAQQSLGAAVRAGFRLVPAWLVAEGDEQLPAGGPSARELLRSEVLPLPALHPHREPGAGGWGMVVARQE